jgi:hypothetical protein
MHLNTIYDFLLASEAGCFNAFYTTTAIINPNKYLYIDSNAPVCLVAHVDTCKRKHNLQLQTINNVISVKGGGILGADDRAGVYSLHCLKDLNTNILITTGEETGGIGARQAALDLDFNGVNLFIELDRKGCNQYVYYSDALPKQTHALCQSFGYVEDYGSYSDIAEFAGHNIPAVNLSIGYYAQHTDRERLHIDEMELNIARVRAMIQQAPIKRYKAPRARYMDYEYSWDMDTRRSYGRFR